MRDDDDAPPFVEMGNEELIRAYCSFEDHEHLTPEQRAIVEEIERRDLEL